VVIELTDFRSHPVLHLYDVPLGALCSSKAFVARVDFWLRILAFRSAGGLKAMRVDFQDTARPERVHETGALIENRVRASEAGSGWPGWMRVYSRTVGLIQWGYALLVGYRAIDILRYCYHPEFHGKGINHEAYLSLVELFFGTIGALLALSGFIGGCGLLALRRWARPWEIAYLSVLLVGVARLGAEMAFDIRSGLREFASLASFALAFGLPYVPFLFGVVGGGNGATLRRAQGEKQPAREYDRVWERGLDF
jgi:hypothetical protein